MSVFLIADIKVTDDRWIPDYAANVHEIVSKHGGKYLARSGNITNIEGDPLDSTLIAIVEFPSLEACQGFMSSKEYEPFAKTRQAGSVSRFNVIDDTDIAGSTPYLKKN